MRERILSVTRDDFDELWSTAQPAGQRVSDKLKWCKEFLAEYDGNVAEW